MSVPSQLRGPARESVGGVASSIFKPQDSAHLQVSTQRDLWDEVDLRPRAREHRAMLPLGLGCAFSIIFQPHRGRYE